MQSRLLDGLRVVDLTDLRGATAGRILADLGADVLKIEPPGGDADRFRPPYAGGEADPEGSLAFLYRHANKRGAKIDLETPGGRKRFEELCEDADVLVENLDPERRERLGLAPEEVTARHPRLVHVAIADFGLSGPRASWRAEPLVAFAASGALYASGFPELPPCWCPGYVAHDCAGVFAALGAVVAVLERKRRGRGQSVEVSVQEAALHGLYPWSIPLPDYVRLYPFLPPAPRRNADGNYLVLPTSTGYVRVLTASIRQWRAFVELLGRPEALTGPEWETKLYRLVNADAIRLVAADILRERPRAEILAEARRLGVPIAPVNTPEEFVGEEQTRAREFFFASGFSRLGDAPLASFPVRVNSEVLRPRRPAPALAEDDRSGFPAGPSRPLPTGSDGSLLEGVRVVQFGVAAVVPELCWFLSELGAEVVKVESRENLDVLRALTPEPDAPNRAWTFNVEGRGQKSVCLNLRTERGRELALALSAQADIVAENYRGGALDDLGLGYEAVRALRPDVIYVSSQGYGLGGPLGRVPSYGPLNASFAGIQWLWNHEDAPYPAGTSLNHPDHIAGKLLAAVVLAAWERRRETGEGARIEMSQAEAAAYLMGEFYLQKSLTGVPCRPEGNAVPYAVPHGVYPCAGEDRWCAIAVVGDDTWVRFRACVGLEPEPRWRTLEGRLRDRGRIDALVSAWTRTREAEKVAELLQAAGVSAMPVQSGLDHRSDPHLVERGAFVTVHHPEVGEERHVGNPLRMGETRFRTAGPAPLLGADTEDVLSGWLGLGPEEVARLAEEGVLR
ncbi:MAG: putative CoA-transferase [Candidatus Binatia bacterium]|nr:MAG: putative CoA-transferase [Candidatus Binatia bacterium]